MKTQKNIASKGGKPVYVAPVVEVASVCVEKGFAQSPYTENYGMPGGDGTLDGNDLNID